MRIGILGAGQLGRMLALAGYPLGHTFTFFDQSKGESTSELGATIVGDYTNHSDLSAFAAQCDVITFEFENVPCETAQWLSSQVPVFPPPRALEVSQDRVIEKTFLRSLGIKTPSFVAVDSEQELRAACESVGFPCIVKTRRFGYDGKGQARITDATSISDTWKALGNQPLIVEGFVPFSRELSIIAVRDIRGAIEIYPLAENEHRGGILYRTEIPAPNVSPELTQQAKMIASRVLEELDYVGVLTVELFEVHGTLVANELAPRVHNSGHATIDGGITSQFENHIRAITNMPLGAADSRSRAVMYNLVGSLPAISELKALPNAKVHLYGKTPRGGRKLGHVTLLDPTSDTEKTLSNLIATTA